MNKQKEPTDAQIWNTLCVIFAEVESAKEIERITAMSEEEIDAYLISEGHDPDEIVERMLKTINAAIDKHHNGSPAAEAKT